LLLGWLFEPFLHCFDDLLSSLDEGSSNVVPSSKVKATKKHGHGENNAKTKKLKNHPKRTHYPNHLNSLN
jgi:hypothetical protein